MTGEEAERDALVRQIRQLIDGEEAGDTDKAKPLDQLSSREEIGLADDLATLRLKQAYATRLFWLMVVQVFLANAVFVVYAWVGKAWDIPTPAIQVWLAATVVQIIGVFYVVTRHLFPNRDAV